MNTFITFLNQTSTSTNISFILDLPMDFVSHYRASWLGAAVLGALSCCNGDTWASELGSVWSDRSPWLITR